jgi:regulator of protease activity HflC (stomatin/prohibitin superfamily)
METRTQIEQVDASSASQDLQDVNAKIALNFHLRGEKAVDVYQEIGVEYKDRIIAPALQEAFKATTAHFTASDLIGRREEVKKLALTEIKARLEKYNIVVDDLNIVNFDFSKDFNLAIEEKVKAEQKKEQAKIEADTLLIQAQGQVNAQKALKESGGLTPEYLNFLAVQKWNGVLPYSTSGVPFVNILTK